MLQVERSRTYEKQVGETIYQVTSECPPDTAADILDAVIELARQELERPAL